VSTAVAFVENSAFKLQTRYMRTVSPTHICISLFVFIEYCSHKLDI